MKIQFENPDKVNGLMTITVEEADYKEKVEKTLKDYRKKANIPGFRPGQVPMGLIKRQYGTAVKVDEVNKVLGEELYKYVRENNIPMLGEPLPSDKQEQQDLSQEGPYTFVFDIAVAPEVKIELNEKDTVDYYDIQVEEKLVNDQVNMFANRFGHYDKAEEYDAEKRDSVTGDLRELNEDGTVKENGIVVESAMLMPQFFNDEAQKMLFDGAKVGTTITFNPRKAYPTNDSELSALLKIDKEQVGEHTGDFTYFITEIKRYLAAEVNQELFDQVFGKDNVKSEEEFRQKIADGLKTQFAGDQDYKFLLDLRQYCEDKVGELTFPTELLKRVMKNNNKDKGDDYVEKNFEDSLKELKWHLIKEQLVTANGIKIDDDDVKQTAREAARAQFAQYGMNQVPDEYLDNYANEMLKKRENVDGLVDRAIDRKLTQTLKNVVKLNKKNTTLEEFNQLFQA